ncbi:SusC/RagA family TonB-linked outer membrane protein [Roseivirga sp. E12]|uniref:SusC/RagA family TonB-linked outer membrane protein n=1 Tax=Roseivirga sp. E12 TaxID=2819237 RepID=UPI001ABBEFC7|nr:SusC/RagA family TonB-linked outer membrane protein [Roseivirga sp. E12]MBO3700704.1 SusC/RagA family TonB-linked outer membrane protein [Roseivirga sp. E12]
MKRILLTCVMLVFAVLTTSALAQNRTVSGKVTGSDDGLPLPQVSIFLKGTTQGTPTNADGTYSISVPSSGGTLVYRFLGYVTQEIAIGNQSVINVSLVPDATSLGEVVVTGVAAATPEKKLAFSVSKVDKELLQQVPQANAANAINGKVAGVRFRRGNGGILAGATLQIRGASQLRTSNAPLIVVDGILIEGSLQDINMQDVENIEVLKGASAASLYGSRAANGVISIQTNSGAKAGAVPTIRFRNEFGAEFLYSSRAPEKTGSHHFATNPDGSIVTANDPNGFNLGQDDPDLLQDNAFPGGTVDHLDQFFKGTNYWTSYLQVTSNYGSGNIAASFENTSTGGLLPLVDGDSRQNLRVNLDQDITDKLKLSVRTLYGIRNRDLSWQGGLGTRGALRNLFMMDPSADLTEDNIDGTPYRWNVNKFSNSESNPLYTLSRLTRDFRQTRFLTNLRLNYEIAEGLNVEYSASIDKLDNHTFTYLPKGHLDISAGNNPTLGQRADAFTDQTAIISTTTLSYVKSFNDWNVRSRAFYQYEDNQRETWGLSAQDQQATGILTYNNFLTTNPLTSGETQITAHNFAAALSGDYQNKYIADLIVRYEGVSLFGADQRWQTFFRGSFNYRISEDVDIPGFQELSIRGSYGTSGNRPNFADQYEQFGVTAGAISANGTLGNSELKNSVTTEYEISLRADFLDKFSALLSYSNSTTEDQILTVPISGAASGGFSQRIANAGTVEGNSIELTLDYEAIKTDKVGLTFGLVFDRYQGEITEFDRRDQVVGLNIWREGSKIGDIYGEQYARSLSELTVDGAGNVLNDPFRQDGVIGDYSINADGFVVHTASIGTNQESVLRKTDDNGVVLNDILLGNATPDFNLGLNTTFRYKDLSVFMLWTHQSGGLIYNQSNQWLSRDLLHPMFDQAGIADGSKKTTAYYLSIYNVNRSNDFYLEDATNTRLAELAINYNINKNALDRMGLGNVFKAAKLSIIGRNLLILSDYTGFDPEVGNLQRPVDNFTYPLVRTFTGSIDLTF